MRLNPLCLGRSPPRCPAPLSAEGQRVTPFRYLMALANPDAAPARPRLGIRADGARALVGRLPDVIWGLLKSDCPDHRIPANGRLAAFVLKGTSLMRHTFVEGLDPPLLRL